jgi:hypothetical protein
VLNKILGQHPKVTRTRHDTTRHDTTRHDTTRHDTTRHDTTRHDTTRHDTTYIRLFSCAQSEDFWRRSVVKSLRKRFPFILSPEELAVCLFVFISSDFLFIVICYVFLVCVVCRVWLIGLIHSSSAGDVRHQDRHLPARHFGHSDDPEHDAPHVRRLQRHLPGTKTPRLCVCVSCMSRVSCVSCACTCVSLHHHRRRSLTRKARCSLM